MMSKSKIEWTESTWNPVTGCTKISPGCMNCYAERMAFRLKAMGQKNYTEGFNLSVHPESLKIPMKWKRPQMIFVNSMSDLFHEDIPEDFIYDVFDVMTKSSQHTFQVLTKRSERLASLASKLHWASNIWMGVSVENNDYKYRIDDLRKTNAMVRFISFEPLLGEVLKPNLENIHWAIVGGESGPGARKMEKGWVTGIRDECSRQNVPFFFKQWGGVNKKKTGRLLEGKTWDQMPSNSYLD